MSGLRPDCDDFAPWGYNSSLQPLARKVEVPVVPPSEYNKHAVPELTPWSKDTAKAQVVESTSGGKIEPPKKDLKLVAE